MKRLYKILFLMVVMAMGAVMAGCNIGHRDIALANYAIINVDGLSGRANATLIVDYDGIYSNLVNSDKDGNGKDYYRTFVDSLKYSLDKYEQISNGDKITLNITYDNAEAERLKLNVSNIISAKDITELAEGTEIDVFRDVELIIDGVAPYAKVTYVNNSTDPFISKLTYEIIGNTQNVSVGDKLTLKCNYDSKDAELFYYYTDKLTMDYVVDGVDSYIYDANQMDLKLIGDIAKACADTIETETLDTTTRMLYTLTGSSNYLYQDNHEKVDKIELIRVDFFAKKGMVSGEDENATLLIFYAVISNSNYTEDGYFIFKYQNALVSPEGTLYMGVNSPELRYICGQDFDALYAEISREYAPYEYTQIHGVDLLR